MAKGTVVVADSSGEEAEAGRLATGGEEIGDPRCVSLEWGGNKDEDL